MMRAKIIYRDWRRPLSMLLALLALGMAAAAQEQPFRVERDIYYGDPARPDRAFQSLDVYWQDNDTRRPVMLYVHGGGWAFGDKAEVHSKPRFFVPRGMALVSMNYRPRWDYKVYHQLEDIVSVIGWIRDNAEQYGFDPKRLILMGHESGAHLVSLIGTDERYLQSAGLSLSAVHNVVAIDTISFDIPRLMNGLGSFVQKRHHRVIFGEDPRVWSALSPITHIEKGKELPIFALLYPSQNKISDTQTRAFAKRLSEAGANSIMIPGNEKTTASIDEELGRPGDTPTQALITFIRTQI